MKLQRLAAKLHRLVSLLGLLPALRGVKEVSFRLIDGASAACYRDPPLCAAARRDAVDELEALLAKGADVNAVDHRGDTALHGAVARRRAAAAACLLYHGADYQRVGRHGVEPLNPELCPRELLHSIRQHLRRYRSPAQRTRRLPARVSSALRSLDAHGLVKLSGLIDANSLGNLRRDFDGFVRHLDELRARGLGEYERYDDEEHFWSDDLAYVSNNAFKHSEALTRLCFDPTLLAVAEAYIGGRPQVTRGVAMRYLPIGGRESDMFGWHHDLEDQRLKMMVLLTDVGPDDQYMGYVSGSHKLLHPLAMFRRNDCSVDYCKRALGETPILRTLGVAGDVFLFDSNGAHRGHRFAGARLRDAYFVEFSRDKANVWGGDVNRSLTCQLAGDGGNPFEWLQDAPKKWRVRADRKAPTWIEHLSDVARWSSSA